MLLENEKISLRAMEPKDLDLLYKWENNPTWWSLGITLAPYSRFQLKEYLEDSRKDIYELKQLRLMINYRQTGATVGIVDLFDFDPFHRRAGIGILVDPAYQRRGIGHDAFTLLIEYAFKFLKLHQLYAHVAVGNEASKVLLERVGFSIIGVMKDWLQAENGYQDVYLLQQINKYH